MQTWYLFILYLYACGKYVPYYNLMRIFVCDGTGVPKYNLQKL